MLLGFVHFIVDDGNDDANGEEMRFEKILISPTSTLIILISLWIEMMMTYNSIKWMFVLFTCLACVFLKHFSYGLLLS